MAGTVSKADGLRHDCITACAGLWNGGKAIKTQQQFYRSRSFTPGELESYLKSLHGRIREQQRLLDGMVSEYLAALPDYLTKDGKTEADKNRFAQNHQKQIRIDMKTRHQLTPGSANIVAAIVRHL